MRERVDRAEPGAGIQGWADGMIDRRRFLFLGAGILASGALVPRSPLDELEAFLDVGREHFGPSIVLRFRDDLTPALERFAREMKRLGEQLRYGLSPGGVLLSPGLAFSTLPMCRCTLAFQEVTTAGDVAAGTIARMRLGVTGLALLGSESLGELVIRPAFHEGGTLDESNDRRRRRRAALRSASRGATGRDQ